MHKTTKGRFCIIIYLKVGQTLILVTILWNSLLIMCSLLKQNGTEANQLHKPIFLYIKARLKLL